MQLTVMPKALDLAIFVLTDRQMTNKLDSFTPAHACGVMTTYISFVYLVFTGNAVSIKSAEI